MTAIRKSAFHVILMIAAALTVSEACGAVITQTWTNFSPSSTHVFNEFDPGIGTLTSIDLTLETTWFASEEWRITNPASSAETVAYFGSIDISGTTVVTSFHSLINTTWPPVDHADAVISVAPGESDVLAVSLTGSRTVFFDTNPLSSYGTLDMSRFIGTSTFDMSVENDLMFEGALSAITDPLDSAFESLGSSYSAQNTITLTYTYHESPEVPEPSSAVILFLLSSLLAGGSRLKQLPRIFGV